MNKKTTEPNQKLLEYQTLRLKDLIVEIQKCCEYKELYESKLFHLPAAELKCVMLFNGERYLTIKGIAHRLDVAKSRVTKIVQGLMEKGLVDRIDDPRDSRIKLIRLTGDGMRKFREISDFKISIHRKILMQMNPEERRQTLSYLEVLRSAMEAVKESMV